MKENNSLPNGFEKLKTEKPYINLSKLAEGEHKFRIVQRPIAGWLDWLNNKPLRFKPENKPLNSVDPARPLKPFWALHVWSYEREGLYIMEVTQNGIRKALESYAMNEDWGDLTSFDIRIKKEGVGKDTSYTVIPIPPKPMSAVIKKALAITKIRLEALYEGKDPWKDLEVNESTGEIAGPVIEILNSEQAAKIDTLMLELDEEEIEDILELLGITSIHEVEPKNFHRVVTLLSKKIAKKREELKHA